MHVYYHSNIARTQSRLYNEYGLPSGHGGVSCLSIMGKLVSSRSTLIRIPDNGQVFKFALAVD